MSGKKVILAFQNGSAERLDKFLATVLSDYSRSRLQSLIKDGVVKVNGTTVSKSGWLLNAGDVINLIIPEPASTLLEAENIPLDVIYENQDMVIVNKPAGMVVHPAPGHSSGTLVHAALGNLTDLAGISGELRPGIVHRLDKDTSGLIIIAKNDGAHRWLQDQFRLRKVEKIYLALVDGKPPTLTGRIEAAIARDPSHRKKMAIVSDGRGREAVSEYKTIKEYADHTLVEVHPLTGRTHQIRLHMALIGCPITGDTIYGKKHPPHGLLRHFLHAKKLTIKLPGETTPRTFEAELPSELQNFLDLLK